MEPTNTKLLKQAGMLATLGKLKAALELYLKIHESEPEDSTIINTIGDLYARLEEKDEALLWYLKLAHLFEHRAQSLNAIATYKKMLKISPKHQVALVHLAQLYERSGKNAEATRLLKIVADQLITLGRYDQALDAYRKICSLDPCNTENLLELAHLQEKLGQAEEACRTFVSCAVKHAEAGNPTAAAVTAENAIRLKVRDTQVLETLLDLFRNINQEGRELEHLHSQSADYLPAMKTPSSKIAPPKLNSEVSKQSLAGKLQRDPVVFPEVLNLLTERVAKKDLNGSLDLIEAISGTPVQEQYHANLKAAMDSVIALDHSSVRTFKALANLFRNLHDQSRLEGYLRHLVSLQLSCGNVREGRDGLNQLVAYGEDSLYLDLLNLLNEGMIEESADHLDAICQRIIQALELGGLNIDDSYPETGLPLGVSDLDLGIGLDVQPQEDLLTETAL